VALSALHRVIMMFRTPAAYVTAVLAVVSTAACLWALYGS